MELELTPTTHPRTRPRTRSRTRSRAGASPGVSRGMSLVEALVGGALLLIVSLSILPLFLSSMSSTRSGADSTASTTLARNTVEEFFQLDFNDPRLVIPSGQTQVVRNEYHTADGRWLTGVAPPATQWTRTVRVRQFSVTDLTAPLDGSTDSTFVSVREIEVEVQATRLAGGPLGPAKRVTLRQFKAR